MILFYYLQYLDLRAGHNESIVHISVPKKYNDAAAWWDNLRWSHLLRSETLIVAFLQ